MTLIKQENNLAGGEGGSQEFGIVAAPKFNFVLSVAGGGQRADLTNAPGLRAQSIDN
jgi:hypothetical protein